jgi:uncharacterized protein YoxC
MMDLTTLAVLVMAAAVAALVIALVPLIQQHKKTLASVDAVVNGEFKELLKSLNSTVVELEAAARGAKEGVLKVDETLEAFREFGGTVRGINDLVDKKVRGTLIDAASYLVGVKVGLGTLLGALKSCGKKEVA